MRSAARRIKRDAVALWFAYRHPGTPLAVKALCVFVVGYALSPIDLIPDFIPVLGYVDDVLLLPGLILLAIRLLPSSVVSECRKQAEEWIAQKREKPTSYWGACLVVAIWLAVAYACWRWYAE
ncbi:YkvA family protein [Cupriavidus basilensis]|uniref:YkvA family protein n=1 Tax=Cupriavidus basilensis TaxID=68895 RepID=A0ABT6B0N7_9BURK|nr:YkvA family protein [Cupriavidus basilensis]MDF3838446.1 YkvA family protein [Cupriavidus basilensis]